MKRRDFLLNSLGLAVIVAIPTQLITSELPIPTLSELFCMDFDAETEKRWICLVRSFDGCSPERKQERVNCLRKAEAKVEVKSDLDEALKQTLVELANFYQARM